MKYQYVTHLEIPRITDEEKRKSALIKTGEGDIMIIAPSLAAKLRRALLRSLSSAKIEEVSEDDPDRRVEQWDFWSIDHA